MPSQRAAVVATIVMAMTSFLASPVYADQGHLYLGTNGRVRIHGNSHLKFAPKTKNCGNNVLDEGEERDPPNNFAYTSSGVRTLQNLQMSSETCTWQFQNVSQIFCFGSCSWGGDLGCDKFEADLLCKLQTGNKNSVALTFETLEALDEPGFSCYNNPNFGVNLNLDEFGRETDPATFTNRGINIPVWYRDSSIRASHGDPQNPQSRGVVRNVRCLCTEEGGFTSACTQT